MSTLTERYIAGIRDNHLSQTSASPQSIEMQDKVIASAVAGIREGLEHIAAGTIGEVLVHVSIELSALAGALEQRGYPADQIPNVLANVLGLAGVRMYVGAELTGGEG